MFAALEPLDGLRVLDLYSGSGALALEALSRGAERAVLVERERAALQVIRRNIEALGLGAAAEVVALPVERAGRALVALGPFDLVLVDPPYEDVASGRIVRVLGRLTGVHARGARLVLEHASRDAPPTLAGAGAPRCRRYGDTTVSVYDVMDAETVTS